MGIASSIEDDLADAGIDPRDAGYTPPDPSDDPGGSFYDTLVPEGSPGRGIDAAILRQFDNNAGGGIFDLDTYNPFNNTQSDVDTDLPTGETIAEGGSGAGWQPLQGQTTTGAGIGPNQNAPESTDPFNINVDLPEPEPPAWLDWTLDNQELVVGLLLVLAFAAATNGTVDVGGVTG